MTVTTMTDVDLFRQSGPLMNQVKSTDPPEEALTVVIYVHLNAHTDRCPVTQRYTTKTISLIRNSSSGVSGHNGEKLLLIY